MKQSIILAAFLFVFAGCSDSQNPDQEKKDKKEKAEIEKKVSKRDYSITKENSYSDLFLDSMDMEKYITDNALSDSVIRRMRSFYNARNFQHAWFSSSGLTEPARGFWNLRNYEISAGDTTLKNKTLDDKMSAFVAAESLSFSQGNSSIINTEFALTAQLIQYTLSNFEKGYVKRKELERFVPFKKQDAMLWADSLIHKKHNDDKYYADVHKAYGQLFQQLGRYYQIAKQGGWPVVEGSAKEYKLNASSPSILTLKKRLQIEGDMPAQDTTPVFNTALQDGIKHFQSRLGYTADGLISEQLIKDLNVTAEERVRQMLINLNRMRWMPQEPEGKLILVNIPEFMLHFFEGKQKAFDMVVVVGKQGHNTMMFTGNLSQVVFSPYWNVPVSIVKNELMPKMASNPNYLASQNMEVVNNNGGLPAIRQLPGEKNALGRVKFLFPNSFDIYFHDTPSKSLFSKDKRAFSHGCIRLSEPEKMAQYLLKDDSSWPPEKISNAMNASTETNVRLKNPVPVFITYYTAWVDENGLLNFRDDIYGHDKVVAKKMFN